MYKLIAIDTNAVTEWPKLMTCLYSQPMRSASRIAA